MQVIHDIFKAFGGPTELARATGIPVQTVHDWGQHKAQASGHVSPPNIPRWRRADVIEAANRLNLDLSPDCIAYLTSRDRLAA